MKAARNCLRRAIFPGSAGKGAQARDVGRPIRYVLSRACLPFQARQDIPNRTPVPEAF